VSILILTASMLAYGQATQTPGTSGSSTQSPDEATTPACPADRPVDDIIAEVKKQQSKKANRNKNPIPSIGCIFGWCRDSARTPPTVPRTTEESSRNTEAPASRGESTSKTATERCNERTELALEAAHNVEVGDEQFGEKSYRAALSRYEEASEQKPEDAAVRVRLGRALEKLNDEQKALEEYDAAAKIGTPEKWVSEAKAAVERLKKK
jgi:tetratricopeptide (TPR) repeat protein